jgi:trk system potassium uptake protein TrkA
LGSAPSKNLDLGRLFYVDHFIGAEQMAARDLLKMIVHSTDIAFAQFAHGAILMRAIHIPLSWTKQQIAIKDLKLPERLIAGLIRRGEEAVIFPHGEDKIFPGDEVTLVGEAKAMHGLDEWFSVSPKKVKSVVLVGGSSIALHLAQMLLLQHVSVRLIESRASRCMELADLLPEATIIHRDGKDLELFKEEQIDSIDALVVCTDEDGTNLLIGSMGKHLGCKKVIALAHDPDHIPLFERAGIVPAMSACVTVANRLLALLHEKSILSVTSLSGDAAKIVELKISGSSKKAGLSLSQLSAHLPKDLLIAAIENQGTVSVGRGHSIVCPDDTVIAICSPHRLEELHELFQ